MKVLQYFLIVIFFILCISCVSISRGLVNEEGKWDDIWSDYEVPEKVWINAGIAITISNDDIQKYSSAPLQDPRLKYRFDVSTPVLPVVKLNSFSYIDKDGNIIPCILYRRLQGFIYIIDELPVVFLDDKERGGCEIFAECSQSYWQTKMIYVNYDIEVGNTRFVKHIKYSKKTFFDWRPKFF